jgi:positive regulator of sigma E activity
MNRKDFIKTTGRFFILGGMAAATGYLVVNQQVESSCPVSSACQKCGQFSECELQEARKLKDKPKP